MAGAFGRHPHHPGPKSLFATPVAAPVAHRRPLPRSAAWQCALRRPAAAPPAAAAWLCAQRATSSPRCAAGSLGPESQRDGEHRLQASSPTRRRPRAQPKTPTPLAGRPCGKVWRPPVPQLHQRPGTVIPRWIPPRRCVPTETRSFCRRSMRQPLTHARAVDACAKQLCRAPQVQCRCCRLASPPCTSLHLPCASLPLLPPCRLWL